MYLQGVINSFMELFSFLNYVSEREYISVTHSLNQLGGLLS